MKAQAQAELSAENEETSYHTGLQRGFLAENRENSKLYRNRLEKKSALRFFIILLAILGVFYVISPDIFKAFWGIR